MSKLTAKQVETAQPDAKPFKLYDGGGLYLLVNAKGAKYWRYDFRFNGKRKTLPIGVYPEVSLKQAREKHIEARNQLNQGIDPTHQKKIQKQQRFLAAENTFEAVAEEWFNTQMADKSKSHRDRTWRALEKDLFPWLGTVPISEISAPELLATLRRIEGRGAIDTAHRAKNTASQIFRYAIATARGQRDPAAELKGALKTVQRTHLSAITDPDEVGKLLVAIDGYSGTPVVKAALRLSPLLFQRPGEIRSMEWSEINWDQGRWEIPAEKMKMKLPHIVPLSKQAIAILQELHRLTGRGRYVFPSPKGASEHLSENGVRTALRTMGYGNETMTPHGFRAMARTLLEEVLEFRYEWIEQQLAHSLRDANGRAYNRTAHLKNRARMMQEWADYLDKLQMRAAGTHVRDAQLVYMAS